MGRRFLEQFVALGGLKPDHHVLDVGCGIGRMALPLTTFLSAGGEYREFDPVGKGSRVVSGTHHAAVSQLSVSGRGCVEQVVRLRIRDLGVHAHGSG